jgi:lipase chaperone LimK
MRRGSAVLIALAAVAAVAAWWWQLDGPQAAQQVQPKAAPAAGVRVAQAGPAVAPVPAGRSPAQFVRWLEEHSSLRGADLDGSWDVDGQGNFKPTIALRRRFDQLLTLSGETPIEQITAFIEHDVRELVGADAAAAVLDAWRRYLELQRYAWRTGVQLNDRSSLAAALAERQQVRRRILGVELAQAFYAEDEAQLQALIQSQPSPAPEQTLRIDRSRLDAAALARVQAEDAAWADWQRRLEAARREVQALQTAPELSALQRDEAIARLIAQRFDAKEAVRVRALLHLPPTS